MGNECWIRKIVTEVEQIERKREKERETVKEY